MSHVRVVETSRMSEQLKRLENKDDQHDKGRMFRTIFF